MSTPIRLAIAGVGNCASSLIQGITYYRDAQPDDTVPGLMHVELGGYHVRDIVPVVAFDVDQTKVGTDLGKAMYAGLNNTIRFADVGEVGVTVQRGPTLDGLGKYYREVLEESSIVARDPEYVTSQPWPFPASLMLGFHARSDAGDPISADGELAEVGFYELETVRAALRGDESTFKLPPSISIARYLIERWVARAGN